MRYYFITGPALAYLLDECGSSCESSCDLIWNKNSKSFQKKNTLRQSLQLSRAFKYNFGDRPVAANKQKVSEPLI